MPSAEERFRAKVQRRGGHEVWTGSVDHRGVGMVRIDGKLRTVQRAAWEFAYEPLPHTARVNSCAGERACVRIEHLSLTPSTGTPRPPTGTRRPKGTGSIRAVQTGVWEIAVTDSHRTGEKSQKRYVRVRGTRTDAERAITTLARQVRVDLGDLRVRELVGRHLDTYDKVGGRGIGHHRRALHDIIEPAIGDIVAADLSGENVERAFSAVYQSLGADQTRHALGLVRDAYRWAIKQQWCDENPTAGITIRALI